MTLHQRTNRGEDIRLGRKLLTIILACLFGLAQVQSALADIVNSVTVTGDVGGITITQTTSTRVNVVRSNPRIAIFKTGSFNDGGDGVANVGDTISYSFAVSNTGNVRLRNVRVTDPLVTVLGGPITVLEPGQSDTTTFTAVYQVTQADIDAGQVNNTGTVEAIDPAGTPVTATDDESTSLSSTSGLTMSKAGSLNDGGDGRADAGDTVLYQFVVTNTGPTTLTNVRISDPLLDLASRASTSRAIARFDGLLTGSDPIMTASTIEDPVKPPTGLFARMRLAEATVAGNEPPPVGLGLHAERRLVQLTGRAGEPMAGDRVGILYTVSNTGDAPLFRVRAADSQSEAFNSSIEQINPADTDTGTILFTRVLSEDDIDRGAIRSDAQIEAFARNRNVRATVQGDLTLAAMDHADLLLTAAISPVSVTTLAPGAQTVFNATYVLKQSDIDAGQVSNIAVASAEDPSGATLTSVDTADVPLSAAPAIALVKTASLDLGADVTASIGDVVSYGFVVTNTGNVTLTNITIADVNVAVAGGPIASLGPGESDGTTFTASHALTQADLDAGQITNQATVTGTPPTGPDVTDLSDHSDPTGDEPTVTDLAPAAQIALIKTMSSVTDVNANGIPDAGDQLNYTFAVTNTGNVTLTNVALTDPGTPITGGPIATLAPGETNTSTFQGARTLTQADIDAGQVTNTAQVTAEGPGGIPVTDVSDPLSPTGDEPTVTLIAESGGIALVKTVSSITDVNSNGVNDVGDEINYAFAVTNTSNVTLTNIAVTDPLAPVSGGPIASLAPGQTDSTTFTARYIIAQTDATAGRVTNQATASATMPSGRTVTDLSDDSAINEDDPTVTPVTVLPSIALIKRIEAIIDTNGNGQTDVDDTIEFAFTITNTGNVTLTNVTIQDLLVAVAGGPLTSLDPGEEDSTTFTASYRLVAADIVAGRVSNQATAFGTSPAGTVVSDLSDSANPAGDGPTVVTLSGAPGIALIKTVASITDVNGNGITDRGDIINYAFAVANTGNIALLNVSIADPKVTVAGGPVARLDVSQTDSTTFTAAYEITQADADLGFVSNQAVALGRTPGDVLATDVSDDGAFNEDDPTVTPISQLPAIALLKRVASVIDTNGNGETDAGDELVYAFAVTNTGNQTLQNISVTDPLVPVSGGPIATLLPGETDSTTFTAQYVISAADAIAGQVSNQAVVTASGPGGTTVTDLSDEGDIAGNNPTVTPVVVLAPVFSKTALDIEIRRGERASFLIAVAGAGAGPFNVVDIMPPGFTFMAGTATANGTAVTPAIDGRRLTFAGLLPDAEGKIAIKLSLRASTSLQSGKVINRAELQDAFGTVIATAQAAVTIVAEHVFDCGEVIGRVFDDKNRNGYVDDGEPGLAGVRVVTVKGLLVTTDKHGRFHVPCADIPDATTGSNFLMKLDVRTLPSGYVMTSENPRDVRLTRGKVTKLNFGASILRQVKLELRDDAFPRGKTALKDEWKSGIAQLMQVLEQEPSILRMTYDARGKADGLASKRLSAVKTLIMNEWKRRGEAYRLVIDARAVGRE